MQVSLGLPRLSRTSPRIPRVHNIPVEMSEDDDQEDQRSENSQDIEVQDILGVPYGVSKARMQRKNIYLAAKLSVGLRELQMQFGDKVHILPMDYARPLIMSPRMTIFLVYIHTCVWAHFDGPVLC